MSGKHILAFEADPLYANMLNESLGNSGYLVDIVSEGVEGLDKAAAAPPDLIYLCVELPRISGFSICNKIKKNQGLKDIPLIIVSAEATEETFEKHKRLKGRADEYIRKPFSAEQIVEAIQSLTGDAVVLEEAPSDADDLEEILIEDDEPILSESDVDLDDIDVLEDMDEMGEDEMAEVEVLDEKKPVDSDVSAFAERAFDGMELKSDPPEESAPEAEIDAPIIDSDDATSSAKLDKLKSQNDELLEKVETLEKELIAAKSVKKSGISSSEFLDLREALNNKDRELLDLKDAVNSKEKENLDLRDKLNGLERQKADLEDKNIDVHKQLNEVEQQLHGLSVEHEHLSLKSADQEQKIAGLEETEASLRGELAAEKNAHAEDVRKEKEEAARVLEARLAEKQAAHDEAISSLNEEKEREVTALQQEHIAEIESLNTAHTERENELADRLEKAEDNIALLKENKAALESELEQTRQSLDNTTEQLEVTRQTLKETEEALETERKEHAETKENLADTRQKLEDQTARGDDLDKAVEALNAEVEDLSSLILRNEEICNKARKAVAIAAQLLEDIETVEDGEDEEDIEVEEDESDE